MKPLLSHLALTVCVVALALTLYDRLVMRPAQQIGVVDLGAVYRAKEAQFAQLLTQSENDVARQQALALATAFAQRLPAALDELPHDCQCLVVLKSAVIGGNGNTVDLTAQLLQKVQP